MQTIEIIAACIGILYVVLEARASIWLWPVGIVLPLFYIYISFEAKVYGNVLLNVYYLVTCIYGLIVWYRDREKGHADEEVTHLPKRKVPLMLLITGGAILAVTAIFFYLTDSGYPVLDGISVGVSLVGMWLLAHKYVENWYSWIISNAIYTYMFFALGFTVTGIFYTIYTVVSFVGYINWVRLSKKKQTVL